MGGDAMTVGRLAAAALCASAATVAVGGEPEGPIRRYQRRPEFALSLPEVPADAVEVALELYNPAAREWRTWGKFGLEREDDVTKGGKIIFLAPSEGRHFLRAVARDRLGNVEAGGGPGAAEIVAVYDRTPPEVAILSPAGEVSFAPGKQIRLAWRTVEANPLEKGAATVHLSTDRGRTWRLVASRLDDKGEHVFRAPEGGACVICVSVRDASGNIGRGVSAAFRVVSRSGVPSVERQAPRPGKPQGRGALSGAERALGNGAAPPLVSPAREKPDVPPAPSGPGPPDRVASGTLTETTRRGTERARRAGARYGEGVAALASGRFKEAVACLREAVRADPGLRAAWLDLSVALSKSGDLAAAEKLVREAASRFPKDPDFPYNLGLVLARLSRLPEAREALQGALRLGAAAPEVHWALGVLAVDAGDLEAASAYFRKVVASSEAGSTLRKRAQSYLRAAE